MPDKPSSGSTPDWFTWAQSIVNGAVGDYLHSRQNGLGINMALYVQGRELPLTHDAILQAQPHPSAKICVLVHGLGCHEGIWSFADPEHPERQISYGSALQTDLGYTPFFVRYNTGLALADNGRRLAELLSELLRNYPLPVSELMLIGHSMGGLIIRHACYTGMQQNADWIERVSQIFYLGSPHEGAMLATLGHVATDVLHAVPNSITRLIGDIFNLRSQGIKDLHAGPRIEQGEETYEVVPWITGAKHYLIAGMLADDAEHMLTQLFGDGLVHLPRTSDDTASSPVLPEHISCFSRTDHLQLAHDPAVYQQIRQWCGEV